MPRPERCRRICGFPDYWSFAPEGETAEETLRLTLDELETIRLIDHEQKTQEECAQQMGVSRATVAGIYARARYKVSDALLGGKRLRIGGGTYRMERTAEAEVKGKGEHTMRIAVTYEEGLVGQHFGRTEQFKLYDIEDGKVTASQVVGTQGQGHGALAGLLQLWQADTLICGGIGMGARMALEEAGITLLPGVSGGCDEAVSACLAGELAYDPEATCHHHDHEEGHTCHHGQEEGHSCPHGQCH